MQTNEQTTKEINELLQEYDMSILQLESIRSLYLTVESSNPDKLDEAFGKTLKVVTDDVVKKISLEEAVTIPPPEAFKEAANKYDVKEVTTEGLLAIIAGLLRYIANIVGYIIKFFKSLFSSKDSDNKVPNKELKDKTKKIKKNISSRFSDIGGFKVSVDGQVLTIVPNDPGKAGPSANLIRYLEEILNASVIATPGSPFSPEKYSDLIKKLNINDEYVFSFIDYYFDQIGSIVSIASKDISREGLDSLEYSLYTLMKDYPGRVNAGEVYDITLLHTSPTVNGKYGKLTAVLENKDGKRIVKKLEIENRIDTGGGIYDTTFINELENKPTKAVKLLVGEFEKAHTYLIENYRNRHERKYKGVSKKVKTVMGEINREVKAIEKQTKREAPSQETVDMLKAVQRVLTQTAAVGTFIENHINRPYKITDNAFNTIAETVLSISEEL